MKTTKNTSHQFHPNTFRLISKDTSKECDAVKKENQKRTKGKNKESVTVDTIRKEKRKRRRKKRRKIQRKRYMYHCLHC